MLALNLLHRNRAPIGARQQCATPNSQAGPCLCSRGAQRVLRSCDMEYVMLHLYSVYLMPGEGQPAAYALPPIFDSREF